MLYKCYLESCCYIFLKLTVRSSSISINHSAVMSCVHVFCPAALQLPYMYGCVCVRDELMTGAHGRTLSNHLVAFTLCRVHAVGGKAVRCEGGSDCLDTLIARVRKEFEWGGFDSSASDPDTEASACQPSWEVTLVLPGATRSCFTARSERVPCSRHLVPSFHWHR